MEETAERSNTTDKLVIDIKVNVKKGATTQITNLTKSLTELNKVVAKVGNLERYANALRQIGGRATKVTANKGVAKAQLGNKNFLETQEVKTNATINKQLKQQEKTIAKQEKQIKKLNNAKNKQARKDKKQNKEDKKSVGFFSKFARSIGRIALYRAIRTILSGAVNSIKEGFQNLRSINKEVDKTFKTIETSSTTLKNSFAGLFAGIVQSFAPYITSITDSVAGVINKFNEAKAVLKGDSSYMKILTSDTKEWQEQVEKGTGSLLEFDKFLSLNQEKGYSGFKEEEVVMSEDEAEKIQERINSITDAIKGIGIAIGALTFAGLIAQIPSVISAISGIGTTATGVFGLMTAGIFSVIGGIASFIMNWENLSTEMKIIIPIASALLGVLAGLVATLVFAVSPARAIALGAIVTGTMLTVSSVAGSVQKYADGGMVEKGTSFIAGEAGAEVVHTSARGTGVTNIEQFSQAMLQALATYGVARGSDVSFKGDVYIDRTKAGQLLEGSVYGEGVRVGHFKRV